MSNKDERISNKKLNSSKSKQKVGLMNKFKYLQQNNNKNFEEKYNSKRYNYNNNNTSKFSNSNRTSKAKNEKEKVSGNGGTKTSFYPNKNRKQNYRIKDSVNSIDNFKNNGYESGVINANQEIDEKEHIRARQIILERKNREKLSREYEEKQKREKEEKERKEREENERKEKEENERKERERKEKERKEKEEKEKKEKEEKEKKEKERKEKEEKAEKERKEKEEKEKEEKEEKDNNKKSNISLNVDKSDIQKIITSEIGFRNLGNTCFMNTCLQNLIHTEYFIQMLFSKSNLISDKTPISEKFLELCKELISTSSFAISPDDFKREFGYKHSMFSGYRQQDTQEFCRFLLEDMNSELNEVKNPAPYKELSTLNKTKEECDKEFDELFRKRENSLIMNVFYAQLINIFKCTCNFETYSFQKILDFPLLLQKNKSISIEELLNEYFEGESIEFETKCEKCGEKTVHEKQVKISQPPNVLILSLQRINERTGTKNNSQVSFPDELDLGKYIEHECWKENKAKYTLYGIGNHSGSLNFGHYYAYIKINKSSLDEGKWYEYNDSIVSSYTYSSNSSSTAYVLFYKKNK